MVRVIGGVETMFDQLMRICLRRCFRPRRDLQQGMFVHGALGVVPILAVNVEM